MPASVVHIQRFPVKGLSPEPLKSVAVKPGEMLPFDRRFALALGSTPFDPAHPLWMPKTYFLMLMRDEKLAALSTEFDDASLTLSVSRGGRPVARGRLDDPMGRAVIEQFFAAYMGEVARGQPKIVEAPGHNFSDVNAKVVSIINLASVKDLERVAGAPVDPLRFRGNFHVEGLPAWAELGWPGEEIRIGRVRLGVMKRIQRCAATAVNPETAQRDVNVVQSLMRGYGHAEMGIYAHVLDEGTIDIGDPLRPPA